MYRELLKVLNNCSKLLQSVIQFWIFHQNPGSPKNLRIWCSYATQADAWRSSITTNSPEDILRDCIFFSPAVLFMIGAVQRAQDRSFPLELRRTSDGTDRDVIGEVCTHFLARAFFARACLRSLFCAPFFARTFSP